MAGADAERKFEDLLSRAHGGDSQAQYMLGAILARQGHKAQALQWLLQSSENGCANARCTLGAWYIQGLNVERDESRGEALLEAAAADGSADALNALAGLAVAGGSGSSDWKRGLGLTLEAARGGSGPALRQFGVLLAMTGNKAALPVSNELLRLAAETGDMTAQYAYARRLIEAGGPDLASEARAWLHQAAHTDHPAAKALLACAPARTGPDPRMVGDMAAILDAIDWDFIAKGLAEPPGVRAGKVEELRQFPYIARYPGFFSEEECSYLMSASIPLLQPSAIIDPRTGETIENKIRTSSGARFWPLDQDLVIHVLSLRIAEASGVPIANHEMLNLLCYEMGQEYRNHFDYLNADQPEAAGEMERSGQRIKTFIVYLNDNFSGGETVFPRLDMTVEPKAGDGVLFEDVDDEGQPNPATLHAGLPVSQGAKWVVTAWLRERSYRDQPL